MHKFISYIKFLFKSNNQHGVHSPFVYDLVTQCFYDKNLYPEYTELPSKRERLIFRCIRYFDIESAVLSKNEKVVRRAIQKANKTIVINGPEEISSASQLLFLESIPAPSTFQELTAPLGKDAVVIVNDIYRTKNDTERWQQIKQLEKVQITIDSFFFGLIFFRNEQAKQDFVIRS